MYTLTENCDSNRQHHQRHSEEENHVSSKVSLLTLERRPNKEIADKYHHDPDRVGYDTLW